MPLLKNKVDITCPFCSNEFEADMTQMTCAHCGTVMYLDEKGSIKEHETPDYHDYLFYGALALSGILSIILLIAAVVGENYDMIMGLGVIWFMGFVGYWLVPLTVHIPSTRQSARSGVAIAIAVSLAIVLVATVSNSY